MQEHHASHLHYDFRLEIEGVLKSWAIPKGPSLNPNEKRLAVKVEDHPYAYKDFEGTIPEGHYGAGEVIIWDKGKYIPVNKEKSEISEKEFLSNLHKGHLDFVLHGAKLQGEFSLIKLNDRKSKNSNSWLLIKKKDEFSNNQDAIKASRIKKTDLKNKAVLQNILKSIPVHSTSMPKNLKPMLAKTCDKAFDRDNWLFEIKWDGFRIIAYLEKNKVKLLSRNQKNYTELFSPIKDELAKIGLNAVIDGEVVVLDKSGAAKFQLLQNFQKNEQNLFFYAFDILWLEGKSLMHLPLIKRKEILSKIVSSKLQHVRVSDHIEKEGKAFFKAVKKKNLEGIMAKEILSPYRVGQRSSSWLKIKTKLAQEAIIAGYTAPKGSRHDIGALILGLHQNNQLIYIGHTGTGFTQDELSNIKRRLDPYIQAKSPFHIQPKTNAPVTWVKPRLVCEVYFSGWTQSEIMRQPVFKGIREDKSARSVFREKLDQSSLQEKLKVDSDLMRDDVKVIINGHTIELTNMNKIFWPKEGISKSSVIDYYRKISPFILPYLKDRPESLNRHPDGINHESFFQKNQKNLPKWVATKKYYSEREGHNVNYLICQNEATLIYMANLGCIEINPWLSRVKSHEKPDFCVFDLDPENISFSAVVETAQAIHNLLDKIGANNYCKTSGATGLHICVPLGAKYSFEQSRQFSEIICIMINQKLPNITSLLRSPTKRQKKVYLDYLQNRRGQTVVAPYSIRPQQGATVSTPLLWNEVSKDLSPQNFTIENIYSRLEKIGDLWKPVLKKGINLKTCLRNLENISLTNEF